MRELLIFAAGFLLASACIGTFCFILLKDALKYIAFKNPSDLMFFSYEEQRLKTDRKHWWTLPLPGIKKKPVVPTVDVQSDLRRSIENAVNANDEATAWAKKVQAQREAFAKNRKPTPL